MKRKVKLFVFLIVVVIVVWYLNYQIKKPNMLFYSGKDNGVTVRIQSIIILSTIFYSIISIRNRIIALFLGFFMGIFSSIIAYLFVSFFLNKIFNDFGLTFHILGCVLFMSLFYIIEKFYNLGPDGSDMSTQR